MTSVQISNSVEESKYLNTSSLSKDLVVKNYSEMCDLLCEEKKTGNAKIRQLKEWHRYFEWEQSGHKYIITKVYKQPLPKIVSDKSTYAKFMQLILMRVLLKGSTNIYYFYPSVFYELSGMADNEFKELVALCQEDKDGIEESRLMLLENKYRGIAKEDIWDFLVIAKKRLSEITNTALKSLDVAALIHYSKEYAVKVTPWKQPGGFRSAELEEEALILEAEQATMLKYNTTNKYIGYAIYGESFRKDINKYIHKHNEDLFGAIRRIRIQYNQPPESYYKRVENKVVSSLLKANYIDDVMKDDDYMITEFCKIALNDLVIDALIRQAKLLHDKAQWGKQKDEYYFERRATSKYLSDFIYMIDNAIKLKTNSRILNYDMYYEPSAFDENDDELNLLLP